MSRSIEIKKDKKIAIIFGASGLVGGHCLNYLLEHTAYKKVLSFGRRKLDISNPKLEEHLVDFENIEASSPLIKGNDLFVCLGTTRAKAGREGFVKVDFDYAFCAAKLAAINGANQLMLVSSLGADSTSLFLYPKTKGRLENAVKKLPFWSVHIFQPSLLLGKRDESRLGEEIAAKLGDVIGKFAGDFFKKYNPIEADIVAKAMVNAAQGIRGGIHIYPSHKLRDMVENRWLVN